MRGTSLRYAGAAATAALRLLANPASLDVGPLDLGIEDHATGAPISVVRTETALDRLQDVLAVELLMAGDLLMVRGEEARPGVGATVLLATLNKELKDFGSSTESRQFHAAAVRVMRGRLLAEVGKSSPRLSWSG
jgi:histidine ammonia-lyase